MVGYLERREPVERGVPTRGQKAAALSLSLPSDPGVISTFPLINGETASKAPPRGGYHDN